MDDEWFFCVHVLERTSVFQMIGQGFHCKMAEM